MTLKEGGALFMVKITSIEENSIAMRHGIAVGDVLISINNEEIMDVLDYRFYLSERTVSLRLSREGEEYTVTLRKSQYADIGLGFETLLMDKKQTCKNGCIFCFIDQNPKGMRESIYFKDDDSRLSFLHGNYITLTNLTERDAERIVKMRFSPINISVHTTNPALRVRMMKNKRAGESLKYLRKFADAGIRMCGQIVLCRGVNDGEELLRTMRDLSEYYPALTSVSVVPAGLTAHRDGLYPLSDFTEGEACEIIDAVEGFAAEMKERVGTRLFFLADEFYLKAKRPLPPEEAYEGYPQIENGVGMLRSFSEEFGFAERELDTLVKNAKLPRKVSIATGVASHRMIVELCDRIREYIPNLQIRNMKKNN